MHPLHLRVPVAVVENDGVCGDEVDAQPSRPRRDQVDKIFASGGVESSDIETPLNTARFSVQSRVAVPSSGAVLFEDVEHGGELGED